MRANGLRRAAMKNLGVLIAACCLTHSGAGAAATTHTVAIDATEFKPVILSVKRGDRVVWVNKDPFPHTATAEDRSFDSRSIAPGKSWSWVAKKPGEYPYMCTLHPTMKGTLIVQ